MKNENYIQRVSNLKVTILTRLVNSYEHVDSDLLTGRIMKGRS